MSRQEVMPRDLQAGDVIDRLDKETMGFTQTTIERVEKVRMANRTAYRVHLADGASFVLNPGHPITVEREGLAP